MHQHAIFAQQQHDPTQNPLDPPTPPGFEIANLGQQTSPQPTILFQIAANRNKATGKGGIAWIEGIANPGPQHQHGSFCYSTSNISLVALACHQACSWATSKNYTHIRIITDSTELVQILRTGNHRYIDIKWTIAKILHMAKCFTICQVARVPRRDVEGAHRLANWWCRSAITQL